MPTRTSYRRRFAQDLRAYRPDEGGVATGGTASTLVQANYPIQKNVDESSEFDGWFLLRPNAAIQSSVYADQVRMINPGGYAPRTGTFTPDRPYIVAPSASDVFEMHGHGFEPWNGIDLLLNAALLDIHIVATIPFVPRASSSGNYVQNLTNGDGSTTVNTYITPLIQPRWVHQIDLLPLADRQVQTLTVTGTPGSGNMVPTYRGVAYSGSPALAAASTAAQMQTALRTLPGLEAVTVSTGATTTPNFTYTITMTGAPLQSPAISITNTFNQGSVAAAITTEQGIGVPQSGTVDLDGNHVLFYANRRYETGDVLYIRCRLPAYYWCRTATSAAWGSLATGLSLETHLAQPPVEWVSAGMQVWAWKRRPDLMQQGVDQRQINTQATAQAEFDHYQAEFLHSIQYSPLLKYPVEGGETTSQSPVATLAQDVAPATAGSRN